MEQNDIIMQTLKRRMEKDAVIDKLKQSLRQSVSDFSIKESVLKDNFQCSLHK